jgi:2-C-methyl-D-erythritol 2,4-cyclodiphosphate synthase
MLKIRSGIGYDIHRMKAGDGLYLGGVKVSDQLQFIAHSDGDVLIHSLIDALLGAIGSPDIGEMFPDTDTQYQNIKSEILLKKTLDILQDKNYEIMNVDCVLIAQDPRLSDYKTKIKKNISYILGIPEEDFNLKAKTKEKLDAVGRGEGIECFCIAMVRKN